MKQRFSLCATRFFTGFALLLTLTFSNTVAAGDVYTWVDENGVIHFSDQQPKNSSANTMELQEVYKPGTSDAYSSLETSETAETAPGVEDSSEDKPAPPLTRAEEIRLEMAEARERQREEQAVTDYWCDVHRKRLEEMEPARRVYYTNDQGERVRMDDDERVMLVDESNAYVSGNCQ